MTIGGGGAASLLSMNCEQYEDGQEDGGGRHTIFDRICTHLWDAHSPFDLQGLCQTRVRRRTSLGQGRSCGRELCWYGMVVSRRQVSSQRIQSRRDFEHRESKPFGESRDDDHEQRLLTTWLYAAQHSESCWGGGIIIIIPVVKATMLPRPLHWDWDFARSIVD